MRPQITLQLLESLLLIPHCISDESFRSTHYGSKPLPPQDHHFLCYCKHSTLLHWSVSRNMVSSEPIEPSTYSRNVYGALPEMGRVLGTGQRRALLGWTHKKDTATGLRKGQIWCWVSTANKLQVYDTKGNRANFRGPRVDCGVASKPSLQSEGPCMGLTFDRLQYGSHVPPLLV